MHAHTFLVIPFIVEKVDFGSSESHRSVLKTLISWETEQILGHFKDELASSLEQLQ